MPGASEAIRPGVEALASSFRSWSSLSACSSGGRFFCGSHRSRFAGRQSSCNENSYAWSFLLILTVKVLPLSI